MRHSSGDLKFIARNSLRGKWNGAVIVSFILMLIAMGASALCARFLSALYKNSFMLFAGIAVILILCLLLTLFIGGAYYYFLRLGRGEEAKVSDLFYVFRDRPDRMLICGLLITACAAVYVLPFIIAVLTQKSNPAVLLAVCILWGIAGGVLFTVLMLAISQFIFILLDEPECGAVDALKKSALLMKGSKGRLFCLEISFIGWYFLSLLSGSLGMLWIMPYYSETRSLFYRDLKSELG